MVDLHKPQHWKCYHVPVGLLFINKMKGKKCMKGKVLHVQKPIKISLGMIFKVMGCIMGREMGVLQFYFSMA